MTSCLCVKKLSEAYLMLLENQGAKFDDLIKQIDSQYGLLYEKIGGGTVFIAEVLLDCLNGVAALNEMVANKFNPKENSFFQLVLKMNPREIDRFFKDTVCTSSMEEAGNAVRTYFLGVGGALNLKALLPLPYVIAMKFFDVIGLEPDNAYFEFDPDLYYKKASVQIQAKLDHLVLDDVPAWPPVAPPPPFPKLA